MAKITQYAEFVLTSRTILPNVLTERIGVQPDEARSVQPRIRGSQAVPLRHVWKVASGVSRKERLDAHVEALFTRLLPYADRLREVTSDGEVSAVLSVVRCFDPGPEEPQLLQRREIEGLEIMRGQHPLVGFELKKSWLEFFAHVRASASFDEYCDEYE
jgi:hypothetical protein